MDSSLLEHLPDSTATADECLDRFMSYLNSKGLELYPAQEEAILELYSGKNLILNTPTGSGKSLVATAVHFKALAEKKRSVYTSPIKALVNEKFLGLCREFGPSHVGMITGDATVNPDALIICCTAEILANDALRLGEDAPIDEAILDEFHYYSDRERGVAWQIPLLALKRTRFLLMSATLGDTTPFERALTELNGRETLVVRSATRPVPLDFRYSEDPIHEAIAKLLRENRAPIYLVNFTQAACAEAAQDLLSTDFCTKEEKKAIATELEGVKFPSPYGKDIQRTIRHGLGLHHAGLLPRYRILVERLAQKGLLKIICGTDTLGVGVNVPIRTVLFTKLCKFDGEKTTLLSVRDFQQIAGRAGRKGFDTQGTVVAQAPEHVIENIRAEQKAGTDPKKLKKLVKKKPPEKGYVPWTQETFQKLVSGQPEALSSRFSVSHGMVLNVLSRTTDGCAALRDLIAMSHESDHAKKQHRKKGFQLFRSLVERRIIEILPPDARQDGAKVRVGVELQRDFSLNQTLALYLLDALKLLEPAHPDYALDLLTLVESILENPELILRRQLDRLKGEKVQELKMQGMEYEERMEELEKLEYPKPNAEFIYETFNAFVAAHPWVEAENIRPKSIARGMYESFQSFAEYIRDLELQKVEGLLLRYLMEVYKVLAQTVPDMAKTDEVREMEEYFRTMVRSVDSSLLDEWERMRNPDYQPKEIPEQIAAPARDEKKFLIQLRNDVFRLVRALSQRDYEEALGLLSSPGDESGVAWTGDRLEQTLTPYFEEHGRILTDTKARSPSLTRLGERPDGVRTLEQRLHDVEGHDDWALVLRLEPGPEGRPGLGLERLGPL